MSGLETLQAALRGHVDLAREAAVQQGFQQRFDGRSTLRIPRVLPDLCTSDVLVMEYISGAVRIDAPTVHNSARRRALRMALRGLYEMIFIDGVVHCDYHPGNLLVDENGSAVLLDFGYVAEIADADRRAFARLFLAMALGDTDEIADVILCTSVSGAAEADEQRLRHDLSPIVEDAAGAPAGDFSITQFVSGLFSVLRAHGMVGTPGFITSIAALLAIEGMLKEHSPDIDFQREAVPYVTAAIAGDEEPCR